MRCSNCGKELTAQDKFCSQCGKAVPPQEIFCSQCGKKLTSADKFCSQCGKPVASSAGAGGPGAATASGVASQVSDKIASEREGRLELLAFNQRTIASSERYVATVARNPKLKPGAERTLASSVAVQMTCLKSLKRMDQNVQHTPEPVTQAEKRAYLAEALAFVEKKIASTGDPKLVEAKAALLEAIQKMDSGKDTSRVIICPHCQEWTDTRFAECVRCHQNVNASVSRPATPPTAVRTPPVTPKATVAPPTSAAPAPQASAGQVRYADESMKNWGMLPGEKSVCARHVAGLLQPATGKFTCYMEVTDRRILLWRESAASATFGTVARMGGGLLGSLISAGAKAAVGAGPKPWVEIPLTAVSSCGMRNKSEFYFTADQTYVLMNSKKYDKFLPDLVANAKK